MVKEDYDKLKKFYGEKFAQTCREVFNSWKEEYGSIYQTIKKIIHPSSTIYEDIFYAGTEYVSETDTEEINNIINKNKQDFKNFVYNFINYNINSNLTKTDKTVKQLLDEAGYVFFECKTEEDIQKFRKFYRPDEEICTFDGGRLSSCLVFFVVKKELLNNINAISRDNPPIRDGAYGTSVMSIQFTLGHQSTISIKNRYNHSVKDSDATLNNDPDKIIPGLTYAFCKEYNIKLFEPDKEVKKFRPRDYVLGSDNILYKYNYWNLSTPRIYFCEDNIMIKDGKVEKYDKNSYIFVENYLIDLKNKTITDCIERKSYLDYEPKTRTTEFPDETLRNIISISVTTEKNEKNEKIKNIKFIPKLKNGEIGLPVVMTLRNNTLISYVNPNPIVIHDFFFYLDRDIEKVIIPNAKTVGNMFLRNNYMLSELDLKNTKEIGYAFLNMNSKLENIRIDKLEKIDSEYCLFNGPVTEEIKKVINNNKEMQNS